MDICGRLFANENCIALFHFRVMWFAGTIAAMSSITYPAISAFVSAHAEPDQQGI